MLKIRYLNKFKKDYKKALKQSGHFPDQFKTVLKYLVNEAPLPKKYKDHKLSGKFEGFRDCHILPDWILIYKIEHETLTLVLARTGSHSDLF